MRGPNSITPAASAGASASTGMPRLRRRAQKQRGVANRLGRRDEQQPLRVGREETWMRCDEAVLDAVPPSGAQPDSRSRRQARPRRRFRGTSSSASGMPRVSATMRSRTRGSIPPSMTESSSSRASPSDRPLITSSGSPANACCAAVAGREDQCDRLGQEAPRDEGERLHRHLVEPLRVIDDAEQGLVVGGGGHQAQHRQPDQETVRRRSDAAAEGDVQRLALRFGQFIEVDPAAVRTAAAARRTRAPCRTPRRPPGRSGIRTPALTMYPSSAVLPTPASPRSTSTWWLPDWTVEIRPRSVSHSVARPRRRCPRPWLDIGSTASGSSGPYPVWC